MRKAQTAENMNSKKQKNTKRTILTKKTSISVIIWGNAEKQEDHGKNENG